MAFTPPDFGPLDAFLQQELARARIPGGVLVVVSDGKIVHLRGYGVSGAAGTAPTADTIFQIGSNSKSFTALAVMQLVEAGKLNLDAPVTRYLPWFRLADAGDTASLTLRHLLNQTSGFTHREGQLDFTNGADDSAVLERRVRALANVRLASPPGSRWRYSNINSVVLGCVIEAVTGMPYAIFMQRRVFEPLGMARTSAVAPPSGTGDVATGHRFWFDRAVAADHVPFPKTLAPSGYISSTARDMGAYLVAHLGGGPRLLSAAGLEELHRKGANTGLRHGYAMGWATDAHYPGRISHEGQTAAYTSAMGISQRQGWGYALLLNGSDALTGPVVQALGPQVAGYLDGEVLRALPERHWWSPVLLGLLGLAAVQSGLGMWLRRRNSRPSAPTRMVRLVWLVPLSGGALLAAVLLIGAPTMNGIDLGGLALFAPDAGLLLIFNAVLAVALGGALTVRAMRRQARVACRP